MTSLYLTEPGTVLRYQNQTLQIRRGERVTSRRLAEIDLLVLFPGIQLTDVVIAVLLDQGIETIFLRQDGQFRGRLQGQFATNPLARLAQYRLLESTLGMSLAQKMSWERLKISACCSNVAIGIQAKRSTNWRRPSTSSAPIFYSCAKLVAR